MFKDNRSPHAGEKKVFTTNMTIGTTLAIVGFFMYSQLKLRKAQRAREALPTQSEEQEPLTRKTSGDEVEFVKVDAK